MWGMDASAPRKPALGFIFITLVLLVLGFGIIIPVLPRLIVRFQGGSYAEGSASYGLLLSAYAVMQFTAAPILGSLSDRFGRRKIILLALAGSAIDYVIMGWAPTLAWLFVARIISGMTAGALAACNAYIADVTPPEKRAQGFGLVGAAFGFGFAIGPAIGGYLGAVSYTHLKTVVGQGVAAGSIARALRRSRADLKDREHRGQLVHRLEDREELLGERLVREDPVLHLRGKVDPDRPLARLVVPGHRRVVQVVGLHGVDPVREEAVLGLRKERGPFKRVEPRVGGGDPVLLVGALRRVPQRKRDRQPSRRLAGGLDLAQPLRRGRVARLPVGDGDRDGLRDGRRRQDGKRQRQKRGDDRAAGRAHGAGHSRRGGPPAATENPAPDGIGGGALVGGGWPPFSSGRHARGGGWRLLLEIEDLAIAHHLDRLAFLDFPAKDRLRKGILEIVLDGPPERTGAVLLVVSLLDQQLLRLGRQHDRDLPVHEPQRELLDLEADDRREVVAVEGPEEHDVRDPVEELRPCLLYTSRCV